MPTLRQMSIMLQVIIALGWSMLLALEFLDNHWTERWIIGTAVLIVMTIAALVFWWHSAQFAVIPTALVATTVTARRFLSVGSAR